MLCCFSQNDKLDTLLEEGHFKQIARSLDPGKSSDPETLYFLSNRAPSPDLELPVLEDDRAIQMAVTKMCRQLAKERIEPKRASTLLYGLQVAAVAVRRTPPKRYGTIF